MDNNLGMVAVVQELRNSGLMVTFLDRRGQPSSVSHTGREHPGAADHSPYSAPKPSTLKRSTSAAADSSQDPGIRHSYTQASDGRYASVYQTSHCNVTPTSPPVQVSEFPPQKSELCPGHGNFEVGGFGSGETRCSPSRTPGNYPGSKSWSHRGAVCSPRSSREPDVFADSLRRYPMMERSSELIERFINYTQSKNLSKASRHMSHSAGDSETCNQSPLGPNSSKNNCSPRSCGRLSPKPRAEESPTRDMRWRENLVHKGFCNDPEVRYVTELPRRVTENMPYSSNRLPVDTDIQVSVEMVSRQTDTAPRTDSSKKTVAISPSPCTSNNLQGSRSAASQQLTLTSSMTQNKSTNLNVPCIQPTLSSIDLISSACNCSCATAITIRKCKSEDKLKGHNIQEEIPKELDIITDTDKDKSNYLTKQEILKDMCMKFQELSENFDRNSNKEKFIHNLGEKRKDIPMCIPMGYELKLINELTGDSLHQTKKLKNNTEVFRAELSLVPAIHNKDNNIENIVKDWINDIPIKNHDFIGRPVERFQVTDTLMRKLLRLFSHKSRYYDISMLKRKIMHIITEAPLDMSAYKKHHLMFRLVDILIDKIREISPHVLKKSNSLEAVTNRYNIKTGFVYASNKIIKPNGEKLTELLTNELTDFKSNYHINISSKLMSEIVAEIVDILTESTDDVRFENNNCVHEEIVMYLGDTGLFLPQQANDFVKHVLRQLNTVTTPVKATWNNRNFAVFESTLTKSSPQGTSNELSGIENITQSDVNRNLDAFVNELQYEINEWLTNLPVTIPQTNEKDSRQDVINDLVGDIVDRHRYLEMTNAHKGNESEELEYLKYQIFKWLKKLVGEEQGETMSYAPDLMNRIRNIPVPMLNKVNQNTNSSSEQNKPVNHCDASVCTNSKSISQKPETKSINQIIQRNPSESFQKQSFSRRSVKDLNEEYDNFVKNWIQEIPIPVTDYIDQETAEKARIGIYHGIWKAVTKLKFYPEVFHNKFYYQDILDDEIEKLLDALPKTDELGSKKHSLKTQFIEKTVTMNEIIKNAAESASFKQQLVQNLLNYVVREIVPDKLTNPIVLNEEPQILNIVENYILYANYKEEDKLKADFYRKKLLSSIKLFLDQLKKKYGQALQDLDSELYVTYILNALFRVPLPSEETMKEERDQILLGIDIEHWLSELPIVSNDNPREQLQRRSLIEALAKKIFEIQKNCIINEYTVNPAVKHEISKFLEKTPLLQNESIDKNFLADELINRMKNKASEWRRKSVTFQELPCYVQFGQDIVHCSSFTTGSDQMSYQASPQYSHSFYAESPRSYVQPNPQFQPNPSECGQYHPTYMHEPGYAPSIVVGGGLPYMIGAVPDMSGSLSQGYMTFDNNRPISSSLHDGVPYNWRYVNQIPPGSRNQSEPVWLTLEETRSPDYGQLRPIQTQQDQNQQWHTLHQYQSPQKHSMFVDGPNGNSYRTNNTQGIQGYQNPSLTTSLIRGTEQSLPSVHNNLGFNMSKTRNDPSFKEFSDSATAPSQIAEDHVNQPFDKRDILQANDRYQESIAGNISHGAKPYYSQKQASMNSVIKPTGNETATDKSREQYFSIPVEMPTSNTKSLQRPCSPRVITNEYGTLSQIENVPETSTARRQTMPYQHYVQLQVPNANTQQYPSSYGQPQGFSTPQNPQGIHRESPAKVNKKRDRVSRARMGLPRRRLELEDSDADESDDDQCHCMERMWRRRRLCYENNEYPCFMPMPFPYPYFFF